jgi:hypothetical protein
MGQAFLSSSYCCQQRSASCVMQVEALNNYSREWPSLKRIDGKWQFRKGFLEPFDDPKVVPFFFYRGLEVLKYSWGERAFQVLVAAAYTGEKLMNLRRMQLGNNSTWRCRVGSKARGCRKYVCLLDCFGGHLYQILLKQLWQQ